MGDRCTLFLPSFFGGRGGGGKEDTQGLGWLAFVYAVGAGERKGGGRKGGSGSSIFPARGRLFLK